MAVLAILQVSNMGGLEQATYRTMQTLRATHGAEFKVVSTTPFGCGMDILLGFDSDARDFPHRGRFGWRDVSAMSQHIRRVGADCSAIWINGTSAGALAAARKAMRVPGLPQTVLSHHHHHFENRTSGIRWRGFYAAMGGATEHIVYPTEFTRAEALRIAPWLKNKTKVIRVGVETHRASEARRRDMQMEARKQLGLPASAWIVGNAGWIIQRKRFDVFLRTAQAVRRRVRDAYFVICGSGDKEAEIRRLASDLGLADVVRFTGWVDDLATHYQAWDVILFNSDYDALGLSPLEAAGWGCLVVASVKNGGLNEFIDNGRNGFLWREHTPDRLADVIAELAHGTIATPPLRVAAWDKLQSDFGPKRNGAAYAGLLGLQVSGPMPRPDAHAGAVTDRLRVHPRTP